MSIQGGAPSTYHGWRVLAHPVFQRRYTELRDEARRLRQSLSPHEYRQHPTVKLTAALYRLMTEIVPENPDAPEYRLSGSLSRFRRAKGRGLPPRYRVFWTFSTRARVIIFLYVNDEASLRKEGDKHDPYAIFRRLVERGEIGDDFAANYAAWQTAHKENAHDARSDLSP